MGRLAARAGLQAAVVRARRRPFDRPPACPRCLQVFQFVGQQSGDPGYVGAPITNKTRVRQCCRCCACCCASRVVLLSHSPLRRLAASHQRRRLLSPVHCILPAVPSHAICPRSRPAPHSPRCPPAHPSLTAGLPARPGRLPGVHRQPGSGAGGLLLHAHLRHQRRGAGGIPVRRR